MTQSIRCSVVTLVFIFSGFSQLYAQAVPITPSPSSVPSMTESAMVPGQSNSILDFSLLNWRMGQLSPYAQPTLTGSATSSAQPVTPTGPATTSNPFIGSTIGMTGSLSSTNSNSSSTGNMVPTSGSSPIGSVYFAPRFVSFADLTPNYGINTTLINSGEPTLNLTNLTGFPTSTEQLSSVPEPGTVVMCGGLLVLAAYSWSRRRTARQVPSNEVQSILAGETNESISI